MTSNDTTTTARIEADPTVPIIRMSREFAATPEQLFRAHTDRELFARWVGPDGMDITIDEWDARSGGSWRYHAGEDGEYAFHGSFHEVRPDRLVQTFTYDGEPDGVALETLTFTDLGNGRTRLRRHLALRQLRGSRRLARQRHGGRRRAGLRQARPAARGRRRLTLGIVRDVSVLFWPESNPNVTDYLRVRSPATPLRHRRDVTMVLP